jgi:CRP/FNR family transcriptional regulator, cyclic AMP receptor protein
MAITPRSSFDPEKLLASIGEAQSSSVLNLPKDQTVFAQGDAADSVFYIQKGRVKLSVVSRQGKEAVVAILDAKDFFGEGCLAGQTRRMATATTMTDAAVVRLEKAAVVRVIHDEPEFSDVFIAHLLGRNIRVEADLVDQLFNSSEKRLARLLLLLANFGQEEEPQPMITKISQETPATGERGASHGIADVLQARPVPGSATSPRRHDQGLGCACAGSRISGPERLCQSGRGGDNR